MNPTAGVQHFRPRPTVRGASSRGINGAERARERVRSPYRFLQQAIGSRKFVVDLPANRLGPGWKRRVSLAATAENQGSKVTKMTRPLMKTFVSDRSHLACRSYRRAAATVRAARTGRFDGMWFRTDANAPNTMVSVAARSANICEGPNSSAHAPAYDEPMPPTRPIATAVPTPVARI